MLKQPRSLMIAGGVILGMALVPGLPKLPFLIIGGGFFMLGRSMAAHHRAAKLADAQAALVERPAAPSRRRGGAARWRSTRSS